MAAADAERWDARYSGGTDRPAVAHVPIALERAGHAVLDQVPTGGTAVDVACGLGAQSLWLAHRGLHVRSLDISSEAIASLSASARAAGLADRISADVCDFDGGLPD
ncbi:MAG: methyltransferase domain-containing protein, partial [Ilumatobacter sp.]